MMRPATEAELAEAIRSAAQPLAIRGGGTRGPQAAGEVLETGAIRGVTLYEPGALTLVVSALVARRIPAGAMLRMALAWVAIFAVVAMIGTALVQAGIWTP